MSSPINETELQKLVDGELDLPAVKQLLHSTDANSNRWRQIATAFIEDRLWQRSFQGLEAPSQSTTVDPPKPNTAAKANPDRTSAKTGLPSWLALAAGLLLAAGVGFFAGTGGFLGGNSDHTDLANAADAASITISSPADWVEQTNGMTLAGLTPEYELELTDAMGIGKSSVPIYSARRLNQLPAAQRNAFAAAGPSEQEIQRLRQSGYQLQQNTDYFSGRLKDGRTFVVPVQTINLSSGQ